MQRAGDFQLVMVHRNDGLGGEQGKRIGADDDRYLQRFARLFGHLVEHVRMARQYQDANPIRPADLAAVDGDVLHAGARVARDDQPGGDVRTAVQLVVGRQGQQAGEIDAVAMHDMLNRGARHLRPRNGVLRRGTEAGNDLRAGNAHDFRHPASIPEQAGDDRNGMAVRLRKKGRLFSVEPLGDGGQRVAQGDAGADHGQPVGVRQSVEPVTQGSDRLARRSVGAACRLASRIVHRLGSPPNGLAAASGPSIGGEYGKSA
jgi:hypothetical protein